MWRSALQLWTRNEGSVAPTVALSLFGLIAAGGIAFDYARLAAMDTELQQAADQAALAAVTQLDQGDDSIDRAEASIQDATATNRLAANYTKFANDGTAATVDLNLVTFCSEFDDTKAATSDACTTTTDPTKARFVWVKTSLRTAKFAFTPIAGAIQGTSHAEAVAGIQSSICDIAPLFVCTDNDNFPSDDDIGKSLLMKTGSRNSWFPGNYGYLDFGGGNTGVQNALMGRGLNGCRPIDESNTAPGNKSATDAINTRFDLYSGGTITPSLCSNPTDGTACPDQNVNKDSTMEMTYVIQQNKDLPEPTAPACGAAATARNANPEVSYTDFALNPAVKGMPRDTCHYSSCADGNFGDGIWDYTGYMAANHPSVDPATVPRAGATPTRYETYQWENAHQGDSPSSLGTVDVMPPPTLVDKKTTGSNTTYTFKRQCNFRKPRLASAAVDPRRILPIVAASCAGLNGASDLDAFAALRVFNVFLVEPSFNRTTTKGYPANRVTDEKEIYAEVLGPAETIQGGSGFQVYSRNRPYLVR
jgi:Flp pilus assembly protein TadG